MSYGQAALIYVLGAFSMLVAGVSAIPGVWTP